MNVKEYEMDDEYKQAAQFLADQIAQREEFGEQLKLLPPEKRPEALRLLAELDQAIEIAEQKLADEYQAYQKMRRLEDERDQVFDELTRRLAGSYVHVKYRNPEMIEQMEAIINDMPPEEAQAFYDCAAQLEAGDLVRIIRREGETREEAEEFLKNYRAAEGKREQ